MKTTFKRISPTEIPGNLIERISKEWMLITIKDSASGKYNMMTASWGMMGFMWNKPIITCVIRPQRYTHEFSEKNDTATFTFYGDNYRKELNLLGTVSGRDHDKTKESGLTPVTDVTDAVYFEQAQLVIVGKKCYSADYKEQNFVDKNLPKQIYPAADFHTVYMYEITDVLIKES